MKRTRTLLVLSAFTIALLLAGALYVSLAETPLPAIPKFNPRNIDMDSTYPEIWYCEIKAPSGSGWNVRDIDLSTVRFEHYIPIINPEQAYYESGAMNVQFPGQAVWFALLAKVDHMGVPPGTSTRTPVPYYFTVSGYLNDGRYFEGENWIKVRFPEGLPPPPPPPP